jgi:hypothetical protein
MLASQWVYLLHWGVYIGSFAAFLSLLTPYRRWGAIWIAVLFLTQALFHGCLVVDLQNWFRVREGLVPIENGMLTDRFGASFWVQEMVSVMIGVFSLSIALIEWTPSKRSNPPD